MKPLFAFACLAAGLAATSHGVFGQAPPAPARGSQGRTAMVLGCLESDALPGGTPRFKLTTIESVIATTGAAGNTGTTSSPPSSVTSRGGEAGTGVAGGAARQPLPAAPGGYRLVAASASMDFAAHVGEKVQVTGTYTVLVPTSSYFTGVEATNGARKGDTTIGTLTATSLRTVAAHCR